MTVATACRYLRPVPMPTGHWWTVLSLEMEYIRGQRKLFSSEQFSQLRAGKMGPMPPIAEAERQETFDYYLRRDIFCGENCEQEFPNVSLDSILLASTELERQLDRRQFNQPLQHLRAHRQLLAPPRNPLWINGSADPPTRPGEPHSQIVMQPVTRPIRADREGPR